MRPILCRSLLVASILSTPAIAQQKSQQSDGAEIIVEGKRDLDQQMQEFVQALTQAPPRGQLSRFEWEACPVVIGLPTVQKKAVIDRMRRVAGGVDIPLASEGCAPNVLVAVTRDRKAFIQDLSAKLPMLLRGLSDRQIRQLSRERHAAAWHIQGPPLNADGQPLQFARFETNVMGVKTQSSDPVYINQTSRAGSRIASSGRLHFSAAVVIVDAESLTGLSTTQLADYAAMRAFARTDPSRLPNPSPETILKVLETPVGKEVPITMTHWDMGFLRGLYASRSDLYATSQRSEIRDALRDELNGQPKAQP